MGTDNVNILDFFQPGDLVCARIIATGVGRMLMLSTTEPQHGVIGVRSDTGIFEPVSSLFLVNRTTGEAIRRKVAQPLVKGG